MDPDILYKWEEGIGLAVDRHRLVTPVELVEITRHSVCLTAQISQLFLP